MSTQKPSFLSVANKIKMGKKVEKSLKGEKNQSAVSQDEEDPNKTPELQLYGKLPS